MTSAAPFRVGQKVKWTWGSGEGFGKIEERFERKVTRTITGSAITRHGSADNPAFLIRQDDGDQVLKLGSELSAG